MNSDEIMVMKFKRLAQEWGVIVVAIIDPKKSSAATVKATSVKKVLGVYVADGYLPLSEFEKAEVKE